MRWIMKMSAWSLACQQSVFQQDLSDKHLSEFYPQATRWRRKPAGIKITSLWPYVLLSGSV